MLYPGCGIKSVLKPNRLFSPERSDRTECSKTGWKRESGLFSPIERTPSHPYGLLTVLSRVLHFQLPNFIVMSSSRKPKCKQRKILFVLPLFFFFQPHPSFYTKKKKILTRVFLLFFYGCIHISPRASVCTHQHMYFYSGT